MKAIPTFAKEFVTVQTHIKLSFDILGLEEHFQLIKLVLRLLATTLIPIVLCTANEPVLACTCRGAEEPPCVAYQKADAIFIGSVTDIAEAPFSTGDVLTEVFVYFSIEQRVKGVSVNDLRVATVSGTDCDFGFKVGERYFVYAYQDPVQKRLTTGLCTRTKQLTSAEDDLAYVREVASPSRGSSILGRDGNSVRSLLEGADILIEGQGGEYNAVADSKGGFKIGVALPGKYRITVIGSVGIEFLPSYSGWRVFSEHGRPAVGFEANVSQGQCYFIDFSLFVTVKRSERR